MNKIIKALLTSKFPNINADVLLDIISATPNPELATELLCGIYEEITVSAKRVHSKNNEKGILTFTEFNKWSNKVHYSYEAIVTKGAYFPKGTKVSDVTMDNFDTMKCSSTTDSIYLNIPTGIKEIRESSMDYMCWEELKHVIPAHQIDIYDGPGDDDDDNQYKMKA